MDFSPSPKAAELIARMEAFMRDHVLPAEPGYADELVGGADWRRWKQPLIMEALKERARREGLWNLFLPHAGLGAGLSNADYAPLAELTGRSLIAPEVFNAIREFLKDRQASESTEFFVENFCKVDPADPDFAATCFALNVVMTSQYKIDLQQTSSAGWGKWHLKSLLNALPENLALSAPLAGVPEMDEIEKQSKKGRVNANGFNLNINIPKIPEILLDNTDRNRTSPFAFTGNKFEFRAVGSSANFAQPMLA